MLRWIVKLGQVDIDIEVSTTSSKMSQHDLPSVDYEKLKHQDWSCSIVAQVFVDADRAGVQRFKIQVKVKSRFKVKSSSRSSQGFKIKAHLIGVLYLNTVNEEVMNASCWKLVTFACHLSKVARLQSHH